MLAPLALLVAAASSVVASAPTPVPSLPLFQGGRTRIDLPGWDGKEALEIAWSGDVRPLFPGLGTTSGSLRLERGTTLLRAVSDSGLWVQGATPDSLRAGGRWRLSVRRAATGDSAAAWEGLSRRWPLSLDLEYDGEGSTRIVLGAPSMHSAQWSLEGPPAVGSGRGVGGGVRITTPRWSREDGPARITLRRKGKLLAELDYQEFLRFRFQVALEVEAPVDTSRVEGFVEPVSDTEDAPDPRTSPAWSDSMNWRLGIRLDAPGDQLRRGHLAGDSLQVSIYPREAFHILYDQPTLPDLLWHPRIPWSGRVQVMARRRAVGEVPFLLADTLLAVDSTRPDEPLWQGSVGVRRPAMAPGSDTGWVIEARVIAPDTVSSWKRIEFTAGQPEELVPDPVEIGGVLWTPLRARWNADSQTIVADWTTSSFPLHGLYESDLAPVRLILHESEAAVRRLDDHRVAVTGPFRGGWFSGQGCPFQTDPGACWSIDSAWASQGNVRARMDIGRLRFEEDGSLRVEAAALLHTQAQLPTGDGDPLWQPRFVPVESGPFHLRPDGIPENLRSGNGFLMRLESNILPSIPLLARGRIATERHQDEDSVHWRYVLSGESDGSGPHVRLIPRILVRGSDPDWSLLSWSPRLIGQLRHPAVTWLNAPLRENPGEMNDLLPLAAEGLPWPIALDSSITWAFSEERSSADPDIWAFRIHAASVDWATIRLDRFDVRLPGPFLDSSADPWIRGFSPWWIREGSGPLGAARLPSPPRCTTSAAVSLRFPAGWTLEGRGWELLSDSVRREHGFGDESPGVATGLGLLLPARITVPGASLLDLDRARPDRPGITLDVDRFTLPFDNTADLRAATGRRHDTLGVLLVSGSALLRQEGGLASTDLEVALRANVLPGRTRTATFDRPFVSWDGIALGALDARLPLGRSDRFPLEEGTLSGDAVSLELGVDGPRLRVERPRLLVRGSATGAWLRLQEAVLDLEGRPLLLSGLPQRNPSQHP